MKLKTAFILIIVCGLTAIMPTSLKPVAAQSGQAITRISVATDGTQSNDRSRSLISLSADGRYIAYTASASNLVAGDTNSREDVFVYDQQTGETTRVSVASDGTQGNGHSSEPSLSADGRYVVFQSTASNLAPDDTNNNTDVFLHDRQTGETSRLSNMLIESQFFLLPEISAGGAQQALHPIGGGLPRLFG